ncbi:unnamed protein product [Notodromas monacha]|uniref:Uncharacterized protein n=1 Tax=Notodromas monacha TaxID=399045 RepID=A0A7R9GFE6_9CRUS|nr:unnamed protein product [Notodromas monacha]CAG0919267.1 unnamed protein product [Notodromas monacha]
MRKTCWIFDLFTVWEKREREVLFPSWSRARGGGGRKKSEAPGVQFPVDWAEDADRPDLVARELVKAAKEYGSTDNITAVVVFLQPPADIIAKIVMDLKASDTWECSNKLKAFEFPVTKSCLRGSAVRWSNDATQIHWLTQHFARSSDRLPNSFLNCDFLQFCHTKSTLDRDNVHYAGRTFPPVFSNSTSDVPLPDVHVCPLKSVSAIVFPFPGLLPGKKGRIPAAQGDVDEKKNGFSESDESDGQAPMRFFKPWRRGNNDHGGPEEKSDMEVGLSLTSNVLSPDSAGFYPEHSSVQPGFPNTVNLPGDLPEVAEEDEEERKQLEMFGVGTGDLLRVSPTPEDVGWQRFLANGAKWLKRSGVPFSAQTLSVSEMLFNVEDIQILGVEAKKSELVTATWRSTPSVRDTSADNRSAKKKKSVDSAISAIDSVLLSGNDLAEPVGEPLSDDDWSYKPGGGAGGAEEDDDDEEEETVHEETNPFRQQEASHVMLNPLATEFIPGEGMSVAPEFLQHMKTVELEQHPAERASEQVETKHAEDQVESCDVRKTSEEISPFEEQVPKELEAITSEPVLSSVDDEDDVVKEAEMDSAPERLVDPALDEASVSETEVEDDFVHVPPGEQGYVSEPVIEPVFVPEPMSEQAFVPQPVVEEPFVPEPVPQEEFVVPQPMVEESFIPEPLAQEAPFVPEPLAQEAAFVPEPLAQEAAFVPEPVAQEAAFMPEPLAQEAAFVSEPLAEDAFVPEPVAEDAFVLEPVTEHVGLPEPVVDEGFVSEPVLEEAFEPVVVEQDVSDPVHTEPIVSEPVVEQEHISVAPFEQEFVSESVFGQEFTQKPVEHDLVEDAVHEPVIESNIAVEPADHSFDNRDFIDEDIVQQEPVPELLEDSLVHSFEETLKISAKAENPFESHQRVFGDENGEVLDHEELVQPVMNNLEHPEHREVVSEFQELEIEFQKTSFDHRESIDHQEKVQEIQEPRVEDPVGFQQPMFDILESDHVEFHQEVDNQESNPVEFQRPVFEIEEPVPAEVQPPTFQLQEPEKLAFEVDEQHFKQPDIDLLPTLSGAAPGIRHVYSEACASSVTMPEAMMMRSDELEDLMHVAPEVNIHSAETNLEEVSPAPETEMTSPAPEEEPVHVAMEAAPDVVQEPEPEPVAAPDVVPEPEPEVMRKAVKSVASKAPLKKVSVLGPLDPKFKKKTYSYCMYVIGKITPVASKASPTAAAKPAPIKKAVGVAKPAAAAAPAGAKPPGAAKPSAGVTKSVSKTATGVAKPAAPAAAKPATAQKILGTGAQKPTTSTVHKPTTSGAQKTAVSGTAQKPVTAAQKPAATGPPKLAAPKPARPVATGAAKPAAGMTRPVASAAAAGAKPAVAKSPASAGAAAKASARPTPTAARPSTARPSPSAEAKPKTLARPATATTAKPKSATASPATAEKKKPSPAPIRRPVPKKD